MIGMAQYGLPALLQRVGARPRGNRHDCPKCGGARTVTNGEDVFYCHKCQWRGNTVSLAKELGVYQRISPAEYRELQRSRELAHAAERTKETRKHAEARRLAESIWAKARPAPETHPYLTRKRVMPDGVRLSCENLVIPVRDVDGILQSLQFISAVGDKRFLSGGRVTGCGYGLGSLNRRIWLCEGFATAATIFKATGEAVIVCFFAGNLQHVAGALLAKYPRVILIIGADNDQETPGNPGRTAAISAARRFGLCAVWPTFPPGAEGTDFNDLALEIGISGVREELRRSEEVVFAGNATKIKMPTGGKDS